MNIFDMNKPMSQEGYPLYTRRIRDIATVYIKDGKILKNRGEREFVMAEEVEKYNNIAIEKDGIVNIYCSEEKSKHYENAIKELTKIYKHISDRIIINIG